MSRRKLSALCGYLGLFAVRCVNERADRMLIRLIRPPCCGPPYEITLPV